MLDPLVAQSLEALRTRLEVREVVTELVGDVEEWHHQLELSQSRAQSEELQQVAVRLARRIRGVQAEKQAVEGELSSVRSRASEVRAKFAVDISSVLLESRNSLTLRARVKALEAEVARLQTQNSELASKLGQEEEAKEDAAAAAAAATVVASTTSAAVAEAALPEPPQTSQPPLPPTPALASVASVAAAEEEEKEKALAETETAVATVEQQLSPPEVRHCLLSDVDEEMLLIVFSFLETGEVLATAQCNRFLFQRVDRLFGTDSAIIRPEWAERHPPSSSVVPVAPAAAPEAVGVGAKTDGETAVNGSGGINGATSVAATSSITTAAAATKQFLQSLMDAASNAGAAPVQLSKELSEALSKKLSGSELKAVLAVGDALKKQLADNEQLVAEKDDVVARLANTETVRDFLVQKLRAAEVALKAAMKEAAQLRRQALADGEIISFLDLRGQELEAQNVELEHARKHLQASLNLQHGTFAHAEKRLGAELIDTKARLEEAENAHRAQKKLLVKEVKSLRAQLDAATKERNIYGAQIRVLRDTLSGGL